MTRRRLPILWRADVPPDEASTVADAYVIVFDEFDDDDGRLEDVHRRAVELGLDCAVEVRNEDDLEQALDRVDPEIFLLSPAEATTTRRRSRPCSTCSPPCPQASSRSPIYR